MIGHDAVISNPKPTVAEIALVLRLLQLGVDPANPGWRELALRSLETIYSEQEHPITPWFAVKWARQHLLPTPEWVLDYFAGGAKAIYAATSGRSRPRNEAEAVGKALGFRASGTGKVSPIAAVSRDAEQWGVAFRVAVERRVAEAKDGRSVTLDAIMKAVAGDEAVSRTKVGVAFQAHGQSVTAQVAALMEFFDIQD